MRTPGILRDLVMYKNSVWLQEQRSAFVPASGSGSTRNSIVAGRTGTRCNIGRPQPRWEAGIALARSFLAGRGHHMRGRNSLSVGSRIRSAAIRLAEFFMNPP